MGKGWGYAGLSRIAKKYGGPEKYVETIKKHSFQQGLQQGEDKLKTKMLVAFVGGAVVYQIPKVVKYCMYKVKEITNKEAKEAEEKLIEEIMKVDEKENEIVTENEQQISFSEEEFK